MNNQITFEYAQQKYNLPLFDLMHEAHKVHVQSFDPNKIQACSLLSVKTGGCSEDCGYCAQSKKAKMPLQKVLQIDEIILKAEEAKVKGSTRFCMGASGRNPTDDFVDKMCDAVRAVKNIGLETCLTMGMLTESQVKKLKDAGLDYYNHNIDTSDEYYDKVTSTHTFSDRIATIELVQKHGIKVCCGGIIGLGETTADRIKMLVTLANMDPQPGSVPINKLMPMPGTPLANAKPVDVFEFVKTIALARILMPKSYVRLAAGRSSMSDILQAMCFYVGANSIFLGEKLLTAINSSVDSDRMLFERIGVELEEL